MIQGNFFECWLLARTLIKGFGLGKKLICLLFIYGFNISTLVRVRVPKHFPPNFSILPKHFSSMKYFISASSDDWKERANLEHCSFEKSAFEEKSWASGG